MKLKQMIRVEIWPIWKFEAQAYKFKFLFCKSVNNLCSDAWHSNLLLWVYNDDLPFGSQIVFRSSLSMRSILKCTSGRDKANRTHFLKAKPRAKQCKQFHVTRIKVDAKRTILIVSVCIENCFSILLGWVLGSKSVGIE